MPETVVHAVPAEESATRFATLEQLYEKAFPPEERVAVEAHQARLSAGTSRLWVVEADECTAGFALCTSLGTGAWLLEYLATEAARRGGGLGARLLARLRGDLAEAGSTALYLEVEAPELDAADPWRDRRLTWYQRQGAEVVIDHTAYAVPSSLTGDPLPMKLLAMPLASSTPPHGPVLRRDVLALYERVYNRQAHDPMVRAALGSGAGR